MSQETLILTVPPGITSICITLEVHFIFVYLSFFSSVRVLDKDQGGLQL